MESQSFCGLGDIVSIEEGVWSVCEVMVAEKGVFIRNEINMMHRARPYPRSDLQRHFKTASHIEMTQG